LSCNITGIANDGNANTHIVLTSKTRIGHIYVLSGVWYWDNSSTVSVTAWTSGIIAWVVNNWPYGSVLSGSFTSPMSSHPGPYCEYGINPYTSPYFTAQCIDTFTLNANLSVSFTLITASTN
jgi:hypothetical protein